MEVKAKGPASRVPGIGVRADMRISEASLSTRPAGWNNMLGERGEEEAGRTHVPAVPPQLDESRAGGFGGGKPHVFFFSPIFHKSGQELEVCVLCCSKNLVEGEGRTETLRRKEKAGAAHLGPQLVLSNVCPPQAASS